MQTFLMIPPLYTFLRLGSHWHMALWMSVRDNDMQTMEAPELFRPLYLLDITIWLDIPVLNVGIQSPGSTKLNIITKRLLMNEV